MMPMGMRRKSCGMEKVENRSRTARVQNDSIRWWTITPLLSGDRSMIRSERNDGA
jgi:hypothetical protein